MRPIGVKMHTMLKIIPVILGLLYFGSVYVHAQSTDSTAVAVAEAKIIEEERVEGMLALAGYLGKQVLREAGSRLNIVNAESHKPKKVVIKVGPFRVERYE